MHARRITTAVLALLSAAAVAACDDDDDDGPVGNGDLNTTVRFFNATTGLTFDVLTNGTPATGNSSIGFGTASACTRVDADDPGVTIRNSATQTNLTGFTPDFDPNGTYTVLVTGTAAAPVFVQLDDRFTTPSAGNAAVRIVNATSTFTPAAWDIYVNPGATLATPAATNVGRNSASPYVTVPAGQASTIRLTPAGQTTTVQNITVPSLAAGAVTTIVVVDPAAGSTTLRTFTLPPCT